MNKILSILAVLTIASGCTTTQVRDYDGENISAEEKQRMMDEGGIQYIEDDVVLIEHDDIVITAMKTTPKITFHEEYEVVQDKWDITAHNMTDQDACVTLHWKLMDFRFVSEHPSEFLVPANNIVTVGTMVQQVWEIQGVRFTPDGSGYVAGMLVRETIEDALPGDECFYVEKEEDIVER